MAHKNFVHVRCFDGIVAVSNLQLDAFENYVKWDAFMNRWESDYSTFFWIGSYDYPTPEKIVNGETDCFTVKSFKSYEM